MTKKRQTPLSKFLERPDVRALLFEDLTLALAASSDAHIKAQYLSFDVDTEVRVALIEFEQVKSDDYGSVWQHKSIVGSFCYGLDTNDNYYWQSPLGEFETDSLDHARNAAITDYEYMVATHPVVQLLNKPVSHAELVVPIQRTLDWPYNRDYLARCNSCGCQFSGPKMAPACWFHTSANLKNLWNKDHEK
jgi:hypothetical protein